MGSKKYLRVKEWVNLQDRHVGPVRSVWRDVFWGQKAVPSSVLLALMMVTSTLRSKLTIAMSHTMAVCGRLES